MARYNTIAPITTISAATTLGAPGQGQFIEFTGTGGYTVQLPAATQFAGSNIVFYNSGTGTVTVSTSATTNTNISGPGTASSANLGIPTLTTLNLFSDGTTWIAIGEDGGPLSATTITASSTVTLSPASANVTLAPSGSGNVIINPTGSLASNTIDNMTIGFNTRGPGYFTTLSANGSGGVTLSGGGNVTAYNTANAALLVTGGVGISGNTYTNGTLTTNGTITASSGGIIVTSGGLTVSAGGASITGTTALSGAVTLGSATTTYVSFTGYVNTSIVPSTNNAINLGAAGLGWANVYTNDLNLSNGIGDYTIVEGLEDLFLYNNKNGKVYKFLVEEVDPSTATPKSSSAS
jgi:hypothetical protein